MDPDLSYQYVHLLRRQVAEIKVQLGSLLNIIDGLPPYVIANLYEGFNNKQAASTVHQLQLSINRFINRLQNATTNLQRLKFDGTGQETRQLRRLFVENTVATIRASTSGLFEVLKIEVPTEKMKWRLEEARFLFDFIKHILDTMYQPPAHFEDNYQLKQSRLRYLKEFIPNCIAGFAGAEQILENWNQMVGLSDSYNSAATSAFNLDAIAQSQAAAVQMWNISSRNAHRFLNPEDTFVVRPHNSTNYFYY